MSWRRKVSGEEETAAIEKARQTIDALRGRITINLEAEQWHAVENDCLAIMQMLKQNPGVLSATQSAMAELQGQLGLALVGERRFEEAFKHLSAAEQLLNMDYESAVEWASNEGITLEGEGESLDLNLAFAVLNALAERASRIGDPNATRFLAQAVEVADLTGNTEARWESRTQLASFTAGLADWGDLLQIGRELGKLAQEQHDLHRLLEAMRQLSEAYVGLSQTGKALEAQRLVVDIARFLDDPSLPDEEQALQQLQSALRA